MKINLIPILCVAFSIIPVAKATGFHIPDAVITDSLVIASTAENPRSSEGDFVILTNKNILTLYTSFKQGGDDHSQAVIAQRISADSGKTWSDEKTVFADEGKQNIMSVSLLRLQSGEIALFYLVKNSDTDCHPVMRLSHDEGISWSPSRPCIQPGSGYFVLNNCRVIQLNCGRILLPVSCHKLKGENMQERGEIYCYYSDDKGKNWLRSKEIPTPENLITQEPGVIELNDRKVLMYIRTNAGYQYFSCSDDAGKSWTRANEGTLCSPKAPALLARNPYTQTIIAVWNHHPSERTPLSLAISNDEGKSWQQEVALENDPNLYYCYPAIEFPDAHTVLVSFCYGDKSILGLGGYKIFKVLLYNDVTQSGIKNLSIL